MAVAGTVPVGKLPALVIQQKRGVRGCCQYLQRPQSHLNGNADSSFRGVVGGTSTIQRDRRRKQSLGL